MKKKLITGVIPLVLIVFLISIIVALNPAKKDGPLSISDLSVKLNNINQLEPVIERLQDIYQDGFSEKRADSLISTLMNEQVTAYDATLSLIQYLDKSNLPQKIDLQLELFLWLSHSELSYKENRGSYDDYVPIEDFGRLAMNWIKHEDPFIRGMAEWAITSRVSIRNNEAIKIWPENEKDAPDWYFAWRNLLKTDFVLEADYVKQGIRQNVHRDKKSLLANADQIIKRGQAIQAKVTKTDNADANSITQAGKVVHQLQEMRAMMNSEEDLTELRKLWVGMRRSARDVVMLAPEIDFEEIIFAYRHTFHSGGNITNGGKSYHMKPGGGIFIKKGFEPTGKLHSLTDQLPVGHMQGLDLGYDADKLIFSYANQPKYFDEIMYESDQGFDDWPNGHSGPALIYELDLKTGNIVQLTNHPYNTDVEPSYLPSGEVVFSSTRSNFASQCSGSFFQDKKITNLYKMDGDGSNIRALSNNKDFDRYARVMNDGQVLYTRWEYQERHLWQTHNLWTARPDGSYQEAIFKQHNNNGPMSLRDARAIPNSHKLVAIGAGHHEWAQGAVFLIDYQKGTNESDGFRNITPKIARREGGMGNKKTIEQGGIIDNGGLYQQPFPLSEETFLVAFSYHMHEDTHNAKNFALYLIDAWGNKELIHRDPILSAAYPVAVKPRPKPPVIADMANTQADHATVYMTNIYEGVPEFKEGEVRYIRVGHHTEWPFEQTGERVVDYNHLHYTPSGSWSRSVGMWTWSPARVIGTVPVEEDGSAYFKVPANIPVYFQALDENYLELRRMRSFITFQPGEVRGCTGCHESRDESPVALTQLPKALAEAPDVPVPPSWGETTLPDFELHIQPIFSQNCASCHNENNLQAGLDFSDRIVDEYYQSYRTLFGLSAEDQTPVWQVDTRELIFPGHKNPKEDKASLRAMEENKYPGQLISIANRFSDNSVSKVREFGSAESKLIHAMMDDYHQQHAKLSNQEWIDLVTWIDLNAPYWGSFFDKEPARRGERPEKVFVKFPEMFDREYKTELIKQNNE